jgi:peptidoglycan/LPS O-acetylase OafA/YrhL
MSREVNHNCRQAQNGHDLTVSFCGTSWYEYLWNKEHIMEISETNKKPRRIDSLTGVRFICIMLILFAHLEYLRQYGEPGELIWEYFHSIANIGNTIFFMLSGFGMMLSSIRKDPDGSLTAGGIKESIHFAKTHVHHLYPIYIAFLIAGIPYFFLNSCIVVHTPFVKVLLETILFFAVDTTLLQSATGIRSFSRSLNAVCWFLSCMFCIYLVSPVIMKFLKQKVQSVKTALIGIALSTLAAFVLGILFRTIEANTFFDDLSLGTPYRRVFYVIPGMLIAQIYTFLNNHPDKYRTGFLSHGILEYIFVFLALIWGFFRRRIYSLLVFLAYIEGIDMLLAYGMLFSLAIGGGVFSKFLSGKRMVYLGTISGYIYLSHFNIINYLNLIVTQMNLESLQVRIMEAVCVLVLTMLVSMLIYRFKDQKKRSPENSGVKSR